MDKKFSIILLNLILALTLLPQMEAKETNDTWLVRSKDPVFTIYMSGMIVRGEPDAYAAGVISLKGSQFLSAEGWYKNGDAVHTFWGRKPIVYMANSTGGTYKIGLAVKNFAGHPGWTKPSGFSYFIVDVFVNNKRSGTLYIEASDTSLKSSYLSNPIYLKPGEQNIKFIWTNDSYNPKRSQDANIEIYSVLLERTPQAF